MQPNALGKVFNFVLRQGQDSRPSAPDQESASAHSAAQAECDTPTSAIFEPTTIVLADNAEVAQHQQKRYAALLLGEAIYANSARMHTKCS